MIYRKNDLRCYKVIKKRAIVTLLFLIYILCVPATLMAQHAKISISVKNASLSDLLTEIEKKSNLRFSYLDNTLDTKKDVTLSVQNQEVEVFLREILKKKGLDFTRTGNTIAIRSIEVKEKQIQISGRISDTEGLEIIGATILEVGTTNGSVSDLLGEFSLNVKPGAKIQISYIGYKTVEKQITSAAKLNIVLQPDSKLIDEVVVLGYGGQQARSTLTTSISKVDSKAFENVAVANVGQSLQGNVSGLRVVNTSGRPGSQPQIVLRGGASIWGSSDALVIIDGIVRTLNDINPSDIESIQVMKDAASTAIYGARANNGVILVTTKRATEGSTSITYRFKGGANFVRESYDFLNAEEYIYWNRIGNKNRNVKGMPEARTLSAVNAAGGYGINNPNLYSVRYLTDDTRSLLNQGWKQMTDPFDGSSQLIFKDYSGQMKDAAFNNPAFTQDHYLSFTGGNNKANFVASIGYYDEDGQIKGTKYQRFTGNFNSSFKMRENFLVNAGAALNYVVIPDLWISESQFYYRSMSLWPTWNPFDEFGNPMAGTAVTGADGNPLYWKDRFLRSNKVRRTTYNLGATWTIIPELTLNVSSSFYFIDNEKQTFNKSFQIQTSATPNTVREATAVYTREFQQQYNATLTYTKSFAKKHNVNIMAGGEYYNFDKLFIDLAGNGAPTDDIPTLNAAPNRTKAESTEWGHRIMSGFGRLTYDFDRKYLFSAVLRCDGISRLSGDNRFGLFPGVSAGWNLHEENFFKNLSVSKVLSTVKPRISYGTNGNVSGLGDYDVQGLYGSQTQYNGQQSYLNTSIINPGLRWESSATIEAGLDIGFLDNRINFILDYYSRKTHGMITNLALPGYTGFSTFKGNLGSLLNSGVEAEVKVFILRNPKGFSWDVSANIASVKNKILKLPENGNENNRIGGVEVWDPKQGKKVWIGGLQEGQKPGKLYAYRQERILRDWDDVTASAGNRIDKIANLYGPTLWNAMSDADKKGKQPIEPGDVLWADLDNNGIINELDREEVGSFVPKITGGFSTNLSYKAFSLAARFDFSAGHTIYNDLLARSLGQMSGAFNVVTEVKNSWTTENPDTDISRFYYADQQSKRNFTRANNAGALANGNNSRYYEKGDYISLRELTFSYMLPKAWISKISMTKASIYLTGQNLFYLTKYSGSSPEPVVLGNSNTQGMDSGRYPVPRTVLLGLSVSF